MHPGSSNASGVTVPIWYEGVSPRVRAALDRSVDADVCVVGAGIAGLTAAYLLARHGRSVVVLDEKPVGGGETGRTSAHLASAMDDRFRTLEAMHGLDATRLAYQSHAAAIDQIEQIANAERIECDLARVDGFLFGAEGSSHELLGEEFAAAQRVGVLGVELLERSPWRGRAGEPCIRFPSQARFHPLKYVLGLADAVERLGGRVCIGARVMNLEGDGPVRAELSSGHVVQAAAAVSATNIPTPINNWVGVYTKQAAYRSYVIGLDTSPGSVQDALYWDMADPYHYVRVESQNGRDVLLVGGEDHKTGQAGGSEEARFAALEQWARRWFPSVRGRVSAWSGQVSEPDDGLAHIGRVPSRGHLGCYVITGDSGMGLTHGTLGAMLVADLIRAIDNPWKDVYDPARLPWRAAASFVKENVNAVAQLADYVKPAEVSSVDQIEPGGGAVLRDGLSLVAVHRDEHGALHSRSAICPHLKCVVRWNRLERSWDCPCHGSRFDATGTLICGPAVDDLPEHRFQTPGPQRAEEPA